MTLMKHGPAKVVVFEENLGAKGACRIKGFEKYMVTINYSEMLKCLFQSLS